MKDGNPRDDARTGEPSAGDESAVATVGSLMDERRRYEVWLAALESRRAETPKHVYSRVHADYTTRLEAVMRQLTGRVEGLRGELTTLATRIASLEEQQHRARDARAEAELRAHVGEMTVAEWETASKQADDAIATLVRQHAEAVDALARTREFLADAERPATPPRAAAPIAAPEPAAPSSQPPRQTTSVPQQPRATINPSPNGALTNTSPRLRPLPGREEVAAPRPVSDTAEADLHVPAAGSGAASAPNGAHFDELAFLSSVVDENGTAAPPAQASAPASPPAPTAAAKVQPVARPAPPPSRNPFAQRAQDKIINNDGAAGPKLESKQVGKAGSGLAANVSGNNPIILRDKSNEAAKTLKCGECGAANYPTEWYCERCGAELASL
jgi:hypothetical protein